MESYLDYMRHVLEGDGGRRIASIRNVMRQSRDVLVDRMTITNEANRSGGENVGGGTAATLDIDCQDTGASSNPSAAPEVAASDEDGDGDGDDEDDRGLSRHLGWARPPHRAANVQSNSCRLNSRQEANMDQKAAIPFVVEHFDRVSDATHIDIAALKAITGKSRATLYRWIDKGILPKPRKLGPTHNFWLAGDIRRALSA